MAYSHRVDINKNIHINIYVYIYIILYTHIKKYVASKKCNWLTSNVVFKFIRQLPEEKPEIYWGSSGVYTYVLRETPDAEITPTNMERRFWIFTSSSSSSSPSVQRFHAPDTVHLTPGTVRAGMGRKSLQSCRPAKRIEPRRRFNGRVFSPLQHFYIFQAHGALL